MSETSNRRRFELGDWLWACALIGGGAASLVASSTWSPQMAQQLPQSFLLPALASGSLAAFASIGAGIWAPLKRNLFGAGVGFLEYEIILMLLKLPCPPPLPAAGLASPCGRCSR